nr:NAD-dependent epimerase/dehydratase family protein [Desulfonatronovibrio magnus]
MGSEAVLKAALRYGCRTLLCSTSEVYGKGIKFPFREDDDVLLGTTDKTRWAYAASKMVDEYLGYAYAREFGLEVVLFRLFNTVGPRQTGEYGMVIPRFARQAIQNEPITVYGDGTQTRSFCDVRDVIRAIESLAQRPEAVGKLFNVGRSQEISMLDLAKRIRQLAGSSSEIALIPYEQAFAKGFEDMQRRIPSTDKIREILGWEPIIPLDDTLRAVIESET